MSSESAPKEGVETVVETSAPATPTDIELENSSPEENESIGMCELIPEFIAS